MGRWYLRQWRIQTARGENVSVVNLARTSALMSSPFFTTCQNVLGVALLHLEEAVLWPSVQQFPQGPPTAASPDSGPQARKRRGIRERRRVLVALQNGHSQFILSFTRAGSLAGVNMGNARTNKGLLQLRIKSCLAIPFLPRSVKNLGQKPRTNLHILSCGCLQSAPTLSQRPPPSSSSSLLVLKVPLARGCHFRPPRDSSLVSDPLRLGGSA